MTDYASIINAFGLVVALGAPVVLASVIGALIAGVLQASTQITDDVISFVGKFSCVALSIYFLSGHVWSEVAEFTQRIWGGSDFYF